MSAGIKWSNLTPKDIPQPEGKILRFYNEEEIEEENLRLTKKEMLDRIRELKEEQRKLEEYKKSLEERENTIRNREQLLKEQEQEILAHPLKFLFRKRYE